MFENSRTLLHKYLFNLFYNVVTKNVYLMNEPQELTQSDVNSGFLVIRVGDINDESEFVEQAYGWARVYVEAYIPPMSRGRLDIDKYEDFETKINQIIKQESAKQGGGDFFVQEDSVLSMEAQESSNKDNLFFLFVKSFVVEMDK